MVKKGGVHVSWSLGKTADSSRENGMRKDGGASCGVGEGEEHMVSG